MYQKYIEILEELLADVNTDYHALHCESDIQPMALEYVGDLQNDIERLQKKLQFVDECLGK